MTTINHTITVLINGVDRSSKLKKDSLFTRSSISNNIDVAEFTILDDDTFLLRDWQPVEIYVNEIQIFGGYVIRYSGSALGAGDGMIAEWVVECKDWSILLDKVTVNKEYTDSSDTYIISDLFSTYLNGDGFDVATNVTSQFDDVDIVFESISLREALNQLAVGVSANWHITPDKSIYWYSPTSPANAAFDIDTVSPDNINSFDALANSIKVDIDATEIVNQVIIVGGFAQSKTIQTDTFIAEEGKITYGPLTKQPSFIWLVTWVDNQDLGWSAYASDIGAYPHDTLRVDGGLYIVQANSDARNVTIAMEGGYYPKIGSTITIQYYYQTQITTTRNNEASQSNYGRIFSRTYYDESIVDVSSAERYADTILDEYANNRERIKFDISEHGLLPGRLISINVPIFDVESTITASHLALESSVDDALLLEDGSKLLLENYGASRTFLIQEVSTQTVVTGNNQFMVVSSVSAGKFYPTLIESIKNVSYSSSGVNGRNSNNISRLSDISGNMGEVITGRALFTDGGTAEFLWSDYGGHTGAVIGREETSVTTRGAILVLQDGDIKAKIGYLDGLPSVGTVSPTGWGIWTENGYFSGVVAATAGEIGGWTIGNNLIYANGGTIATKALPINSSNPGVYITSDGLFGYGTVGLVFSIPTDPALKPTFSSGTILNTVYEITTASVLRTGTTNPRVQIDNSGIFAYDSGGVARFTVDATTGQLTATKGTFSGTISAAVFTGGTVTQGTISAAQVSGGTINGALITGGTVQGGNGTATLDSNGLYFQAVNGASLIDQASVRWQRSGTTAIQYGARYDGSFDYSEEFIGVSNTKNGRKEIHCYGTATESYSLQVPNAFSWWQIVGGTISQMFGVGTASVTTYKSILPTGSTALTLGAVGQPFRYLYLSSPDGNDWRIEVTNAGALTVTSV